MIKSVPTLKTIIILNNPFEVRWHNSTPHKIIRIYEEMRIILLIIKTFILYKNHLLIISSQIIVILFLKSNYSTIITSHHQIILKVKILINSLKFLTNKIISNSKKVIIIIDKM